jgi:beta-lactamase class D
MRSILFIALAAACGTAPRPPSPVAVPRELAALRPLIDTTGYTGTVVVLDVRRGTLQAVHGERATRRLIPASTYKILHSLIALETGVVASDSTVLPWDSVARERKELNRDLDLRSAFQLSAVPHYQAIAREVGSERMQRFVDAVPYGNRNLAGGIDQFWLEGGLRISAIEQAHFLARLYRGELPFSPRTQAAVKRIMVVEQTPAYTLRAKTGLATVPGGEVGWWVGWVERGEDVFVFATALENNTPGPAFLPARLSITRAVLRAMGILPPASP